MANYAAQIKTRRGIETIEVEASNLEKLKCMLLDMEQ